MAWLTNRHASINLCLHTHLSSSCSGMLLFPKRCWKLLAAHPALLLLRLRCQNTCCATSCRWLDTPSPISKQRKPLRFFHFKLTNCSYLWYKHIFKLTDWLISTVHCNNSSTKFLTKMFRSSQASHKYAVKSKSKPTPMFQRKLNFTCM